MRSDPRRLTDLELDELPLHLVLSSVPPLAPPVGFRDGVMKKIAGETRVTWEWTLAALLAFPSLAFLARQILDHGEDFATAMSNVIAATSSDSTDAFFFVDGLTVLALALIGVACVFAAHALLATAPQRTTLIR